MSTPPSSEKEIRQSAGITVSEGDFLSVYRTAFLLTRSFEESGEILHEVICRKQGRNSRFSSAEKKSFCLTKTAVECALDTYLPAWDENAAEIPKDFPPDLAEEEENALKKALALPLPVKSGFFLKEPFPKAVKKVASAASVKVEILQNAVEKVFPSEKQREELRNSFSEDGGNEKSTRFNAGWLIPKAVAGLAVIVILLFAVAVIVRAPAIYGTEFVLGKASVYTKTALPVKEEGSKPETSADFTEIGDTFENSEYADCLRITVRAEVTDAVLYTGGSGYGICVYTVRAFEALDIVNVTDFLSDSTELTVVEYLSAEKDTAGLCEIGGIYTFWLYTSEDHSAVNPLGQEAGIIGAWEIYEKISVPESSTPTIKY